MKVEQSTHSHFVDIAHASALPAVASGGEEGKENLSQTQISPVSLSRKWEKVGRLDILIVSAAIA